MKSRKRGILWTIKHELFSWLIIIGMRDRHRCPQCLAVGTWKPHGHPWDKADRPARRWMCKWCGLYDGPEETKQVYINLDKGYWDFPCNLTEFETPQKVCRRELGLVWPWRG